MKTQAHTEATPSIMRVSPERLSNEYAWRPDESPTALQFNRQVLSRLEEIVPTSQRMIMQVLGLIGTQARRVWQGQQERTAAGVEEWESYITIEDLIHFAKPAHITESEAAHWMRVVTTTMQGVGTVADNGPISAGPWYFVEPLWWIKAAVHDCDDEGLVSFIPQGFIVVPSSYFRSAVRESGR